VPLGERAERSHSIVGAAALPLKSLRRLDEFCERLRELDYAPVLGTNECLKETRLRLTESAIFHDP
jgi:DNA-binding ferritin-like protein